MNKKYKLTKETKTLNGKTLYRIRALKTFSDVNKGDLGGWVEGVHNLSHEGACWIYDNGCVRDNAWVRDNGCVLDNGCVCDNGLVRDNGCVSGNGCVLDHGWVRGNGCVSGYGRISNYRTLGSSRICTHTIFYDSDYFILESGEEQYYEDCFLDPLNPSEEELTMFELEYGESFPLELVKGILRV